MVKWDYTYELGHKVIDAEHRIFVRLIADFQEAITAGAPKEKKIRVLNIIVKFAEFHFVSEEEIMTEYEYPEQTQHAHLHNILLREIKEIFTQFQQEILGENDVSEFLNNWFLLHISKQDRKLVGYVGKTS